MTEIHNAPFDGLTPTTAYQLWQLRERVFVVEQQCPYLDLDGRDLEPSTRHLWIGDDGPVAYLRVLDEGDHARIGRVAVALAYRGRGLAEALLREALTEVGGRPCRLDAQSYLVGWYTRLGFTQDGEEFLEDGIPHVPMRRPGT